MQAVILLTLVIIAGFLFKKEKSPYARMVIGSVFGVIFFSIWPFTLFFIEIHELSKNYQIISYIVISLVAILLALLLLKIKHELAVAIFTLFLFATTTITSMSFESKIKNKISIHTGYFDKKNITLNDLAYVKSKEIRNMVSSHNYVFSLNKQWQKNIDKGPLFKYFQMFNEENKISEFRPKCFNSEKISLPEIVNNLKYIINVNNMIMDKYCYKVSNSSYSCRISSLDQNNKVKRTRWYLMDSGSTYGIELDFVILNNYTRVDMEIEQIINSIKITDKSSKDINCLGLTEWM